MVKRACIWMVLGLMAGLMIRSGLPPVWITIAQVLFYSCGGLMVLSLLFSLFEEADEPEPERAPVPETRR